MPRVYEHIARKDFPECGIARGQRYYEWKSYRQRAQKSPTPPTRAQLTANEVDRAVFLAYDQSPLPTTEEDIRHMADGLRDAASEEEEKYENVPDNIKSSDVGRRIQDRAEAILTASVDLEEIADRVADISSDFWEPYDRGSPEGEKRLDEETVAEAVAGTEPEL